MLAWTGMSYLKPWLPSLTMFTRFSFRTLKHACKNEGKQRKQPPPSFRKNIYIYIIIKITKTIKKFMLPEIKLK